jgi:hypothetical protein
LLLKNVGKTPGTVPDFRKHFLKMGTVPDFWKYILTVLNRYAKRLGPADGIKTTNCFVGDQPIWKHSLCKNSGGQSPLFGNISKKEGQSPNFGTTKVAEKWGAAGNSRSIAPRLRNGAGMHASTPS